MRIKIREGLQNGTITYRNDIVRFGNFAIGGILAETEDELIEKIEQTLYRKDFGGMRFFTEDIDGVICPWIDERLYSEAQSK